MKLSEILEWPKKWKPIKTLSNGDPRCEGFNKALELCDREIDKEALAKILYADTWNLPWEKAEYLIHSLYIEKAEKLISTMPTWLKRSEKV